MVLCSTNIYLSIKKEEYQIGCEWIDHDNIADVMNLTANILTALKIEPILQISNINIPKLVAK